MIIGRIGVVQFGSIFQSLFKGSFAEESHVILADFDPALCLCCSLLPPSCSLDAFHT